MRTTKFWGLLTATMLLSPFSVWGQGKRVRISLPSRSTTFFPMFVAQRNGFYRAEGLHMELIVMRPSFGMQAMMAGGIDLHSIPGVTIAERLADAVAT